MSQLVKKICLSKKKEEIELLYPRLAHFHNDIGA